MPKNFVVFDFPVSGGSFALQVGLLNYILSKGVRPEVVCGASGGNVPAILCAMSVCNQKPLLLPTASLSSSTIALKRFDNKMLNFLFSVCLKPSVYSRGIGVVEILRKNSIDFDNIEIWTSCTRSVDSKIELFCSSSSQNCKMKILPQYSPIFVSGDVDKISSYCQASCAIPGLLSSVTIDGVSYIDSGVMASSCYSVLSNWTVKNTEKSTKVFIFSPFGIDFELGQRQKSDSVSSKMFMTITDSINTLVYNLYVKEREQIVSSLTKTSIFLEVCIDQLDANYFETIIALEKNVVVEVVSTTTLAVSITDFDHQSIANVVKTIESKNVRLRFYVEV